MYMKDRRKNISLDTDSALALMQEIYNEIKTPYKYGLVMVPTDNSYKMDCPSVFRKEGKWFMTYLIYDGRGYETWLAESDDLLHWKHLGKVMSFSKDISLNLISFSNRLKFLTAKASFSIRTFVFSLQIFASYILLLCGCLYKI